MCGIAGVVGFENPTLALERVQHMTHALARRGPDSEGIECWPGVVLGHRRLAIFDLSDAGRQPMMSPDRSLGLVFNGAIYNFRALRTELAADGAQFRSRTDTEVLLHGYRRWGVQGLVARLRGMVAFGLWDNTNRTLYLVRDRLGIKPLVYAARNGSVAFASTVRALRAGGWSGDLDEAALAEYLEFGFVTDRRAIYQGLVKVPAASIVRWQDGVLQTEEYWTPPTAPAGRTPTFEEAVAETERLFLAAVQRRPDADVPVGALASGWWRSARRGFEPGPFRRAVHFLDYAAGGLGAFIDAHDGLPTYHRQGLLGERLAGVTVEQRRMPWSGDSARRVLADYLEYDRRTQFVAEYLTKVDGAAMHYGLEARSPFLDQDLWEFACTLPPAIRLRRGGLKAVLRELARRRIGDRIARGRKRGFSIPVERWLAGRWLPHMEATLRSSRLVGDGWMRSEGLRAEITASARRGWARHQLWYLYVLESWMRAEQTHQPASRASRIYQPIH